MSSQHHRHSLVLLSMDNTTVSSQSEVTNQRVYKYALQVGRYYCVASNERGQATKSILVTGLASNIRVTSDRSEIICGDIFVFISILSIQVQSAGHGVSAAVGGGD